MWRRNMRHKALVDEGFQKGLKAACRESILFWFNAFVWTYDPRLIPYATEVPFVTFDFQDEAILNVCRAIEGGEDCCLKKSRDMGASWILLGIFKWYFNFKPKSTFLVASRKKDYVDATGNPDSLFWKLDFIHRNEPGWLRPQIHRIEGHLQNMDSGSVIDGETTNTDLGRGGRRTAVLLDEFAAMEGGAAIVSSVEDVANCVIYNSTPMGIGNPFYMVYEKTANKIEMLWYMDPRKNKGLYTDENGKVRSPWYDQQCARRHPMHVAQQIDADFLGSDYTFFEGWLVDSIRKRDVRPPTRQGYVIFDDQALIPLNFRDQEGGNLLLWLDLDTQGKVSTDRKYVIGCDIATGTSDRFGGGASCSSASVVDAETGEKVAEYTTGSLPPYEFANQVIVLAKLFKAPGEDHAFIMWESNGPGEAFGRRVLDHGCRNVYFRQVGSASTRLVVRRSDVAGWQTSKSNKKILLEEYREDLRSGAFINRSAAAVNEMLSYIFTTGEDVFHSAAAKTDDPSGAKDNHGDRVIADMIANKARKLGKPTKPQADKPTPKPGTFAFRRQKRLARRDQARMKWN